MRGLNPPTKEDKALALLWEYLTSTRAYLRGNIPVAVISDKSEIAMLQEAQHFLRNTLASLSIAVEVNPSSNMLGSACPSQIGEMVTKLERFPRLAMALRHGLYLRGSFAILCRRLALYNI